MSIRRLQSTAFALATLVFVGGLAACGGGGDKNGDKNNDGVDSGGSGGAGGALDAAKTDVADLSVPTGETVLLKMESVQGVSRNPQVPTLFTLTRASYITRVLTYHYAETIGSKHPTVAFQDTATGKTYGPWGQMGYRTFNGTLGASQTDPGNVSGPPDNYWIAYPGEMVPAGTYQVVDSDPKTWCSTADLGNRGIAFVWGWLAGAPSGELDGGAKPDLPIDAASVDAPAIDAGVRVDAQPDPTAGEAGVVVIGTIASTLVPAPGLTVTDYAVYGTLDDNAGSVSADGRLQAAVNQARSGFFFATPKDGSATAGKLALGSGLYMAPTPGSSRVCRNGTTWSVATTGTAVLDATTTVMSILLMHPMVANLAPDVQTQQLQWMVSTLNAGWPNLTNSAAVYDRALAAGADPFADATFKTALTASLGDVLDKMPEYKSSLLPEINRAANHVPYSTAQKGQAVTSLKEGINGSASVTLEPGTESGEGLDYYYSVKEIAATAMPQELASPAFTSPNMLQTLPTVRTVASGFVASTSYWKYLDIAGFALQAATDYLADTTGIKPGGTFALPQKAFYEVRFFSGGFGYGGSATDYDFVQANFPADAAAAFRHNVATAVVETLSLIPGADKLLKSEIASKVIAAAVQQTMSELSSLLNRAGAGGIAGKDLANLMYNVCKAATDTFTQEASQASLKSQVKTTFTEWFKAGGKATLDFILSVPGNIAKGGSLSNRAFRLARPDSVMEYYIVAVGFSPPAAANYSLRLTLDWGTDGCAEGNSMTVGHYMLVREIPVTVDATGNFTLKFSGPYGYDTWTIDAVGTYIGGAIRFSSGKWSGDVYQSSGRGPIANDSGTFSTGSDGKVTATYSNVMTAAEMTYLGRTKPDTCAGAATVSASMTKLSP
jgi:hypothetical protein